MTATADHVHRPSRAPGPGRLADRPCTPDCEPADRRIPVEIVDDAFLGWCAVSLLDSDVKVMGQGGEAETADHVRNHRSDLVIFQEPS